MQVRSWIESVYNHRHSEMDKAYFGLLANLRVSQLSEDLVTQAPKISSSKKKTDMCFLKLKESRVAQDAENYFDSDTLTATGLLCEYTGAILDISLNEVSIHSKGHSEFAIQSETPYRHLEEKFMKQTRKIYEEVCARNYLDRKIMERFISVDSRLVSQLFLNRTIRFFFKGVCEL